MSQMCLRHAYFNLKKNKTFNLEMYKIYFFVYVNVTWKKK